MLGGEGIDGIHPWRLTASRARAMERAKEKAKTMNARARAKEISPTMEKEKVRPMARAMMVVASRNPKVANSNGPP